MSVDKSHLKTKMPSSTSNDKIKKLIHSASILVKQLDTAVTKAKACRDLFTPEVIELRSQLSYLCVKSIKADPLQCRRRAEELLWKKCYYDVISYAKINGKKLPHTSTEKLYIGNHIDSGIVKFTELMQDALLRLENIDPSVKLQLNILPIIGVNTYCEKTVPKESKEELVESIQKILIWLGDLSRYQNDLGISCGIITSERFYRQAILVNPYTGLPYNQLGTLTSHDTSRSFESIFYYIRSMKALKPFPGAEPNLKALLARLVSSEDKLVSTFSQLLPKLIFPSKEESTFEISQLCQVTLGEIQNRLRNKEQDFPHLLELAAVVVLSSTTIDSSNNNDQSNATVAFCCSLFSHILKKFQELFSLSSGDVDQPNANNTCSESTPHEPTKGNEDASSEDEEEETKRAKLRRRKVGSGSSDQEYSEEELFLDSSSEQESDEEVLSDSGFHSAGAKPEPGLEIPLGVSFFLPVFKLLTDWFQVNSQVVKVSNQTIRKIWVVLADILNVFKRCQREDIDRYLCIPLQEDWKFYGLNALSSIHANYNFLGLSAPSNVPILNSIRIDKIIMFGNWLANEENNSGFKLENGIFMCHLGDTSGNKSEGIGKKTDLMMRNMAHLWLKSEVQELERRLSPQPKRKKKTIFDLSNLSFVYLVPDVSVLSEFTHLIKQVIKSQKLIVVVPDVVISELDQLKRESSSVRECIRWLESCFRTGNRFIRAQRQNEHKAIPLLTYPKRKDKASWTLFQILECCYYLDTTQRNVYKNSQNSSIVLYLTGHTVEETEQHTKGICNSIGVEFKSANTLVRKGKTKIADTASSIQFKTSS